METDNQDYIDLTTEQLKAQLSTVLRLLEEQSPGFINELSVPIRTEPETERVERYLSEFTQREGILLTIAGLFTFFLSMQQSDEVMKYFLIWVLPLFFISVATYVCSSRRVNIISYAQYSMRPDLRQVVHKSYKSALRFHSATDLLLVTFLTSFAMNYYIIHFWSVPDYQDASLLLVIAIIAGYARHRFIKHYDQSSRPDEYIATGGSFPEEVLGVGGNPIDKGA